MTASDVEPWGRGKYKRVEQQADEMEEVTRDGLNWSI